MAHRLTSRWLQVAAGLLLVASAVWLVVGWLLPPVARPNVVIVTIDTLRADHLGTYGYSRPTSPAIDRLATRGVVFDAAFTQATLSGPSHATMFTGLHVPRHQVLNNGITLEDDRVTLAEMLRSTGYETAMFVGHEIVGDDFGLDQGFDLVQTMPVDSHGGHHFHDDCDAGSEDRGHYPVDSVFQNAIRWLTDRSGEQPFFLWIHAQHVHESHDPPVPFDSMFAKEPESAHDLRCSHTLADHEDGTIRLTAAERDFVVALYDGEIAYVDDQLGGLFQVLEDRQLSADTVIVLTADHGELLFDDPDGRITGHGRLRFDAVLRVPLIVLGPGVGPGRIGSMVGLIDITPTVLDLAGVRVPTAIQGKSLAPLMRGEATTIREINYSSTFHTDGTIRLSARSADCKAICDKREGQTRCQYFDLVADPEEHSPVLDTRQVQVCDVAALRDGLEAWFRDQADRELTVRPPSSERVRRLLERAGYLRPEGEP